MQAVKAANTSLEYRVTHELWSRGVRFRRNVAELTGNPDISIKKYKIVIFIDSCFWHACPFHCRMPGTNTSYWEEKFQRNKLRDRTVNNYYMVREWHLLRVWEHEIQTNFQSTIERIVAFIGDIKNPKL